ncbi:exonuclease domain-containing protein [Sphingobacterium mizutaii]|uniref:exonuclease domain-containing protein n=1 Tax=Sphingobacterium mizutaii TaxID=1010 RepID=UPI00289FE443|nr:exonuclease domain-containing protein [Sphingobacterium mizutaii]
MGVILVIGVIIVIIYWIGSYIVDNDEKIKKENEQIRLSKAFDERIELENKILVDLTNSINSLANNSNSSPIEIEINGLPIDFQDKEYTAIDFETANKSPLSAISLGIAHFKGNSLVSVHEFNFSPIHDENLESNDYEFTKVHGLTRENISHLKPISEQWDEIEKHLNKRHLVAHNAEFDLEVLKETLTSIGKELKGVTFSCTYKLAKRFMRYESSYKLENLCLNNRIPYWNHQAGFDAVSAGILFMKCISLVPNGATSDTAMNGRKVKLTN